MAADKIEEFLRNRLARLGEPDTGQRKAEYHRTWDLLKAKAIHADGSINKTQLDHWKTLFKSAMDRIEAEYALADSIFSIESAGGSRPSNGLDRLPIAAAFGQMRLYVPAGLGVYGLVDFLSPLLKDLIGFSAAAAYLLVGIVAFAGSRILSRLPSMADWRGTLEQGWRGGAAIACIGAMATGLTFAVPGAAERGLFAAAVPGLAGAQDAMLGRIEQNTREAAEGIQRVEQKVEVLKKETSEDPCKELVNIGFLCDDATSQRAVLEGNRRLLGLLLAGGQPVSRTGLILMLQTSFQPVSAELILQYPDLVPTAFCTEDTVDGLIAFFTQQSFLADPNTKPEARDFFIQLCGREALQKRYTDKLDGLRQCGGNYEAEVAKAEAEIEACKAEVVAKQEKTIQAANSSDVPRLLEQAWNDGFEKARTRSGLGDVSSLASEFISNEQTNLASSLVAAEMMGADLRVELPNVARMGCEFGMPKPEKPSDDEIAEVEKVLAGLN